MSEPATGMPREAASSVIAANDAMRAALPFNDVRDFDDAKRGFLGTIDNAEIANDAGKPVWSLRAFAFLDAEDGHLIGEVELLDRMRDGHVRDNSARGGTARDVAPGTDGRHYLPLRSAYKRLIGRGKAELVVATPDAL